VNTAPQLTVCWQQPSGLSRTNGQLIVALTNSHGLHAALSKAQFRSRKFYKRKIDSPSHQIFGRMHKALNIDKK
jgi:hypothetical protein